MTTLIQNYYTLKANVDNLEKELMALEGGKKASSARSRKCLQTIKSQSFNMRKDITNYTKSLPTKKRASKILNETVEVIKSVEPVESIESVKPEVLIETIEKKTRKPRKVKEVKII